MKETLADILPPARDVAAGLLPGALGAAIAVAIQGTMSWGARILQLTVGIIVSYYASELASDYFEVTSRTLVNSIGFCSGLGAYESAKKFRTGVSDVAGRAPGDVWDWWLARWEGILGGKSKK